jgi:hypothetical protein
MIRFGLATLLVAFVASTGTASAQYQPGGSYLRTCRDISFDGANLMATCRAPNGNGVTTVLDTRACAPRAEVNNDYGRLVCAGRGGGTVAGREMRQPPRGNGWDNGRSDNGWQGDRPRRNNGYEDDWGGQQRRQPPVREHNWGGPQAPGGSYLRTCRVESFDGVILTARCRDTDGEMARSRIDVRQCRGDIGNQDGRLNCSR